MIKGYTHFDHSGDGTDSNEASIEMLLQSSEKRAAVFCNSGLSSVQCSSAKRLLHNIYVCSFAYNIKVY